MRIHAASSSAAVTRTLEAIIVASGHELVAMPEAELLLLDADLPLPETTCPHWIVGSDRPAPGQPPLPHPFRPQQLKRLLSQRLNAQSFPLSDGWSIDPLGRCLQHADRTAITLTEKECTLLKALQQAYPAALSRDTLLAEVWGITHEIDTHTLETHIYRLRHKLEGLVPAPCDIVTEGGAYSLKLSDL